MPHGIIMESRTNIIFLDYDGVVNTPMWDPLTEKCRYGQPRDNKVNNYQACQWLSEFCEKYNYDIVVTSTWRIDDNYIDCLYNGGLRKTVKVLGRTVRLNTRAEEIMDYLKSHKGINKFIIVDDEIVGNPFIEHTVLTRGDVGFNEEEFLACKRLDEEWFDGCQHKNEIKKIIATIKAGELPNDKSEFGLYKRT